MSEINHEQRRQFKKLTKKLMKLNNVKMTNKELDDYVKFKDIQLNSPFLEEGEEVKINYKQLTSEPSYKEKRQEYKDFIEKNKDTVFNVEYDEKYKENPWLVSLKQDTTNPKWLFTTNDLIKLNNKKENN